MTTVAIVVALVVVAVVAFLACSRGRSGAGLQAPAPPSAAPPAPTPRTSARPPPKPPEAPRRAPEAAVAKAPEAATSLPSSALIAESSRGEAAKAVPASPSAAVKRDVAGLRKGLAATRGGFIAKLTAIFQGKKEFDPAILEQLEEVMLASDVGPKTTQALLARLRESLDRHELRDAEAVWGALRTEATRILSIGGGAIQMPTKPTVVLMVG